MTDKNKKLNFGLIMAVYLLGIFMGALDTGIVTPARTIIQDSLGVDAKTGIWMITIYTLAYAASIPVMGKLADRMGRRTIYLLSIFLFGAGSLFCGLSQNFDSWTALLIARAVQAIGGGGIMPVATAEFGTTFPEEKRGMALGMVGGVYGVANIIGASVGSAVLDIFGQNDWKYIFFVNVPIAVFILIAGFISLPNTKEQETKKIDGAGIGVLVVMVLCLMYGLRNIDFFDFTATLTSTGVYPYLIAFCLLLPLFIFIENHAEDPVMNLSYFKNRMIVITLILAIITGVILMGLVFVPQLCENIMGIKTGSGGYFVIILGLFAGLGAPLSGGLTDKRGPKLVLGLGLAASIAGSLFLIFVTMPHPGWITIIISLTFIGIGLGFTMGAPLNYMMLWEIDLKESNSALATLSLVRSLGTVIAPAIMVGFIAHAGMNVSGDLMALMPKEISVPQLPYAEELNQAMKDQGIEDMPDLTSMQTIKINMADATSGNSEYQIPDSLLKQLQESDVTTITASVKDMASYMFGAMSPKITKQIYSGIDQGIDGVSTGIDKMNTNIAKMQKAESGMTSGIDGMSTAIKKQAAAIDSIQKAITGLKKGYKGVNQGLAVQKMMYGQLSGVNQYMKSLPSAQVTSPTMPAGTGSTTGTMPTGTGSSTGTMPTGAGSTTTGSSTGGMPTGTGAPQSFADQLPAQMKAKLAPPVLAMLEKVYSTQQLDQMIQGIGKNVTEMTSQSATMKAQLDKMENSEAALKTARAKVISKRAALIEQRSKMREAIAGIKDGKTSAKETLREMKVMKAAVPGAFKTAEKNYLAEIDSRSAKIEKTFQDTLNVGFRQIYVMTIISSAVGILLLMLYKKKRRSGNASEHEIS